MQFIKWESFNDFQWYFKKICDGRVLRSAIVQHYKTLYSQAFIKKPENAIYTLSRRKLSWLLLPRFFKATGCHKPSTPQPLLLVFQGTPDLTITFTHLWVSLLMFSLWSMLYKKRYWLTFWHWFLAQEFKTYYVGEISESFCQLTRCISHNSYLLVKAKLVQECEGY